MRVPRQPNTTGSVVKLVTLALIAAVSLAALPNLAPVALSSTALESTGSGAATGGWTNVSPSNADLVNGLTCGNYGTYTLAVDPARPSDMYTHFDCQGMWK